MKRFRLPDVILDEIEACLSEIDSRTLQNAAAQLFHQYRKRTEPTKFTETTRLAYLAARLPATYAVARTALNTIPGSSGLKSILDLGSGPGTVFWAAVETFPYLTHATLLEQDPEWITLANILKNQFPHTSQQIVQWDCTDLNSKREFPAHDLVVSSYVLSELTWSRELIEALWKASKNYLVFLEPGTPKGFEGLRHVRSILLEVGAHLFAPCTHESICPLAQNDWCHFSLRLERSSMQQLSKAAELPYEDEKFSYMIFSRQPVKTNAERVIRKPIKRFGHVILDLCGKDGIQRKTVSKKHKKLYQLAKKISWGEEWSENLPEL